MSSIIGINESDTLDRWSVVLAISTMNNVSATAMRLIVNISTLCENKGYCSASNKELSERINISDRQIRRGVAELIKLGAITKDIDPKTSERTIYVDDKLITF